MQAERDAVVVDLEAGKVREFAAAVHADPDDLIAPDGAVTCPATFLTTMNFLETAESVARDLEMELPRMLHAEQSYEFPQGPPTAGTRLRAVSSVDERFEKVGRRGGRLRFAVRTTEFRNESGALVAVGRLTAVEPESAPGMAGRSA